MIRLGRGRCTPTDNREGDRAEEQHAAARGGQIDPALGAQECSKGIGIREPQHRYDFLRTTLNSIGPPGVNCHHTVSRPGISK